MKFTDGHQNFRSYLIYATREIREN